MARCSPRRLTSVLVLVVSSPAGVSLGASVGGRCGSVYSGLLRDPSDRFPKAPTKEEEEYRLALRGPVPGMMTYRGWT